LQAACNEAWAKDQPNRLEASDVVEGGLYVVKLGRAEGEFCMGLARTRMCKTEPTDKDPSMHIWWYTRCGKSHSWSSTTGVKFKQYGGANEWVHDPLEVESLLLRVTDADLTPGGKTNPEASPCLTADFVQRLRLFAAEHTSDDHCLVNHKGGDDADDPTIDDTDEDDIGTHKQDAVPSKRKAVPAVPAPGVPAPRAKKAATAHPNPNNPIPNAPNPNPNPNPKATPASASTKAPKPSAVPAKGRKAAAPAAPAIGTTAPKPVPTAKRKAVPSQAALNTNNNAAADPVAAAKLAQFMAGQAASLAAFLAAETNPPTSNPSKRKHKGS
jgi:hypothetical protein